MPKPDKDLVIQEMLSARAVQPPTFEQMTDIYGVPCDVHRVRTFRNKREMGVGYSLRDPRAWFVYDRESQAERWHMHCGPYSTFDQAVEWIRGIREDAA